MTTQQEKVLKPKLCLLELARQLGNVSQACHIMGWLQPGHLLPLQGTLRERW